MADAIAILTYHSLDDSGSVVSVSPLLFADQMAELADGGWRGVNLSAAVAHKRESGGWRDKTVVITFDDAYASFHEHALAVLADHGFSATVFVISDYVGGANDWAPPPAGLGRLPLMSWSDITDAAQAGIEIGAHSRTHPDLSRLNGDALRREVEDSGRLIADRLGAAVRTFAYPYGATCTEAVRCVERCYDAGCTTQLRRASDQPSATLPRVDAYYLNSRSAATACAAGGWDGYLAVRRLGRRFRAVMSR